MRIEFENIEFFVEEFIISNINIIIYVNCDFFSL